MITSFTCRNFRAFSKAKVDIRPITIFLGANGIGKTSLLQIPLLFQQTAEANKHDYHSPIKLHGRSASFGDATNILFNRDTTKELCLGLTLESEQLGKLLRGRIFNEFSDRIVDIARYLRYIAMEDKVELSSELRDDIYKKTSQIIRTTVRKRNAEMNLVFSLLESISSNNESVFNSKDFQDFQRRRVFGGIGRMQFGTSISANPEILRNTRNWVSAVSKLADGPYHVDFSFKASGRKKDSKKFSIASISIFGNNVKIFEMKSTSRGKSIYFFNMEKLSENMRSEVQQDVLQCFDTGSPIFDMVNIGPVRHYVSEYIIRIVDLALGELMKNLVGDAVNHVTPLRAMPKRYYFLDLAAAGGIQGDSLVELLRENDPLRKSINNWFKRLNIEIKVEQFREIVHQLTVKRSNLGFDLDITDVGFGISQVLPVVVQAFFSKPGSITIIEQPEIHLHPNMQADLADLFIDAVAHSRVEKSERRFLIETHSEYFLNRLRRRVSEGIISSDDVGIYFVERSEDDERAAVIREIDMKSTGSFEWPLEFYEKSLDDTMAFLKRQT